MPTYEYVCEKCGHHFEKIQSIAAKPLAICPESDCAGKKWAKGKVKRVISGGAGLLFKGSGFYITDYRSENYKAGAKKETPSSGSSESKSGSGESKSGGTESKPAKTETKAAKTPKE
jgi:putative FmdB family regulatory protein